jgi:transposase
MKAKTKTSNTSPSLAAFIGIDLGDKKHHACVTDAHGTILQECIIPNDRAALKKLSEDFLNAAVAIEVGAHSPWISRFLVANAMDVTVANARKLRAIYQNDRKCDQLDARMLAKLLRADRDLLSPIQHGSEQAQKDLIALKIRDSLVRQHVNIIATIRGVLKSLGLRIPASSSEAFHHRAETFLTSHPELADAITPALQSIQSLTEQIKHYEKSIQQSARAHHPQAMVLQKIPSIGPITSMVFVLSIEDPNRFKDPRDIGAYLGLVPRRDQSGATDKQLPISKAGNKYLRALLTQCAQYLLGRYGPDCAIRQYGLKLAARGGKAAKKKAIAVVARKLAVMMIALWKKGGDYQPFPAATASEQPTPGKPKTTKKAA